MDIKTKRNGQWVDAELYTKRNGVWVKGEAYAKRNGIWTPVASQTYTKTWTATWTQTYREAGTKRTDYRSEKICQGRYVIEPWGIMCSFIGFGDIQSELAGAKIKSVELFLHNEHWYYYAGGLALLGYHNNSYRPNTNTGNVVYGAVKERFDYRGQSKWITMPNDFAEGIRDGSYKGVSMFAWTTEMLYYGIFSGANDGDYAPKLKITYEK
ncbi:hypothetical protein [Bacillus paranthracis]|uniref:hypothetical protein n=1 Tax=Bacillus paranthracis TaxID=2026186 RepID=UPI002D77260E|nr:hypothetical protein [Bacillus paranthracis]